MVKKQSKKTKNNKSNGVYHKKKIPKKVKEEVWYVNFGKIYEDKCYISWCSNKVNVFNFHVGHDIPESKGGTDEINNLKPICDRCNLSMGHNYTIKEWNTKFNKSSNKEHKITNNENNIIYYNICKYLCYVIVVYIYINNYNSINSNVNKSIKSDINDINDINKNTDLMNNINNINNIVNNIVNNIFEYVFNYIY